MNDRGRGEVSSFDPAHSFTFRCCCRSSACRRSRSDAGAWCAPPRRQCACVDNPRRPRKKRRRRCGSDGRAHRPAGRSDARSRLHTRNQFGNVSLTYGVENLEVLNSMKRLEQTLELGHDVQLVCVAIVLHEGPKLLQAVQLAVGVILNRLLLEVLV